MSTINNVKKSRGRPTIDSEAVTVRMERELLEEVDAWRDNALGQPNRPEAVRRLVKKGLEKG